MKRYVPAHESQYGADRSARTRESGCTWTAGAIGIDASTGGRIDPEPDAVLAKVARTEETSPSTPGWSLHDLAKACSRMSVPFVVRSGAGWAGVKAARKAGLYIVLQGDSDRFPDGCSGAFDGDHAIGIPPDVTNPQGEWGINDPICSRLTYESEVRLRAYAEKFAPTVAFGVFTRAVPDITDEEEAVFSVPGIVSREAPAGTPYYESATATTPKGRTGVTRRYLLVAQDKAAPLSPTRYLVDGAGDDVGGRMSWISASSLSKSWDESFNAGVRAASASALKAGR